VADTQDNKPIDDLSALAWVQAELRRSLENANKALRRYLRESESAAQSDIDASDPAALRSARLQLHQGAGALELVGQPAAARLLRAAEAAVQRMIARPAMVDEASVHAVERASFALLDYLGRLLAGKKLSPVGLFPQYAAVQALAGADRVHPADLWDADFQWQALPAEPGLAPRSPDEATRGTMEAVVLHLMRRGDPAAWRRLSDVCAELGAGASGRAAALWQLAAAFGEAEAAGLLPRADLYTKRMAARLLAQLRLSARGEQEPSARLAQDLLFYCAHAQPGAAPTPRLDAVRQAWFLQPLAALDYAQERLGRFDPAWIAQARKRVAGAKDVWSALAGGEQQRLSGLVEQMALLSDSVERLFPGGARLAKALQDTAIQVSAEGGQLPPPLAMEVATSILYLDATLEDGELDHPALADRVQRLAERIEHVRHGQEPDALEPWMEELYRRVSDRQTMGSVVHELRASLSEVEKQVDAYFRDPAQRELLIPVPGQLQAMRGVLSVLGLDQASAAVLHMRDQIDALAQTEVDPQHAAETGSFDRLADNLGALSFLIDLLGVQPALAKSLFRFDPDRGSLSAVMGHGGRPRGVDAAPAAATLPLLDEVRALADSVSTAPDADHAAALELLSQRALAADLPGVAGAVSSARQALAQGGDERTRQAVGEQLASKMEHLLPPAAAPEPPSASKPLPPADQPLEDDAEMREIFLEEAREVIEAGRNALQALAGAPDDLGELTTVRRAFHTLKGSSRMVGLREFGEAAWACEQLYNARLASAPHLDIDLAAFTHEALDHLETWIDAIAGGDAGARHSAAIVAAADALRLQGKRIPVEPAAASAVAAVDDELPVLEDAVPELPPAEASAPETPAVPMPELGTLPLPTSSSDVPQLEIAEPGLALPDVPELELPAVAQSDPGPTLAELVPGLPLAEDLDLSMPAPAPVADAAPDFELDLGEAGFELQGIVSAQANAAPPVDPSGPVEAIDAIDGDAPASSSEPVPAVEADALADVSEVDFAAFDAAQIEIPAFEAADSMLRDEAAEPSEVPAVDLAAETAGTAAESIEASLVLPELADLQLPTPTVTTTGEAEQAEALDEQTRVIGDLRIPIPLFNIYLNEADELSRRLSIELAEWGIEYVRRPPASSTTALAHSLAGSSATVGYTDLSGLARALEHALLRSEERAYGSAAEAELYNEAADEIRRLLHQFAAGFLKAAPPGLVERLAQMEQHLAQTAPALGEAPLDEALDELPDETLDEVLDEVPGEMPGEMPGETSDEVSDETFGAGAVAPREPAPPTVDALMTSFAALDALPQEAAPSVPGRDEAFVDDEAIEVVDAIDPDLFPIFEEEAEELLPQLQTRLRDWLAQPGDAAASSACMRTLHTFKGGARLAGAMRLGEMAHRLETAIEHLGASPAIGPERIEALLVRAENMREAFDALRGPQPASAPAPAAEPLPVALPLAISELQAELQAELQPGQLAEPSGDTQAGVEAAPVESLQARQAPRPAAEAAAAGQGAAPEIDWSRFPSQGTVAAAAPAPAGDARPAGTSPAVRVRASLLDRMVNQAGEVSITRERIDSEMRQLQGAINDLTDNLERLRSQLRDIELQAETQIGSRIEAAKAASQDFDPLEMDRYTRFQELTRMMAESVNDVATVQRAVQRTLQSTEDQLAAQARLTRELQDDLLRTRMVEFESLADRLYRVVRQAAKDSGKQVRLDIVGGSIEVDRGVLDRMVGPFEHLLRNSVVHGIEDAARRSAAGKAPVGEIRITATQEGNEIGVECRDDGAGLDLAGIRARAVQRGLLAADEDASDAELAGMIFRPGFSTAGAVTELAGRGVGMDVVRAEVNAMGGRIETASTPGQGTSFRLVLPLTTAVTQVVLLRCDGLQVAVPSTLVEVVRRVPSDEVERAYSSGGLLFNEEVLPFFWLGALLQQGPRGTAPGRMQVVVIVRSAAQRVALHVDEVVGNQEVVVKHVGPQLARLPGLAGVTLLPSGAIALIYNPVALAALFGQEAQRRAMRAPVADAAPTPGEPVEQVPLVLVVDDSLTVRRVTQRLLAREGYRVVLAKDGLEAIERLAQERPAIMLTDIEMPRMDGFDLVRNVRADPALAGLPVVMITSRIAQKHRDYAAELGVDHYLGKPYGEEELLRLVAQYAGHPAAIA